MCEVYFRTNEDGSTEEDYQCDCRCPQHQPYPGKGIFQVTVERDHKIKRVWLVAAETIEEAEVLFRNLNQQELDEGDEPLILDGEEISLEPLEFERGVSQMW